MRRVELVHGPTPIVARRALSDMIGLDLWIKRDDATGGAEAGNKVRKLEYLLGDALDQKSTVILTCGGTQSNHARATAIVCASLGLRCVLFLRRGDGENDAEIDSGNLLIDRLVGAEIRWITPAQYADRARVMADEARHLGQMGERAYVIPEGGSNGLGSFGYVDAMEEVRVQLDLGLGGGPSRYDVVAHACGSGGTAAGVALGAGLHEVAERTWAFAVCNDTAYFERTIARIVAEALMLDPELPGLAPGVLVVDDRGKGPAYAVTTPEQRSFIVEVARRTGLLLDPVYTGKALYGLFRAVEQGDIRRGARALFVHTGGLPGLLAQGRELTQALG